MINTKSILGISLAAVFAISITKTIMFVMIAAILVSGTVIVSEVISEASALKSKGNTMLKVGSTGSPVCGDHLCTVEELEAKTE